MKRLSASLLAIGLAATSGLASAQTYGSNGRYDDPAYRNPNDVQPANGGYYDYARVVRVDPVMGSGYGNTSSQRCYSESDRGYAQGGYDQYGNDGYYDQNGNYRRSGSGGNGYYDQYGNYHPASGGTNTGRTVATVIGGIAGAVLGSKVGGGSGQVAASAIGTMVGGMAGRQVYDNAHRPQRTASVQVCDPVPANGYYGNANNVATGYDVTYEYAGRRYTTRTSYNPGDRIRVRVDVRPE
ncbi:MAG TPA: glycine zipper 2TM domain-containing protein [Lysobacter sp.]|nr:glycine zipper 2TM domain-containing protein [Lysobacter sp.]